MNNFYEPVKKTIEKLVNESFKKNNRIIDKFESYLDLKAKVKPLFVLASNKEYFGEKDNNYLSYDGDFSKEIEDICCINTEQNLNTPIKSEINKITFMINSINDTILHYKDFEINLLISADPELCGGEIEDGVITNESYLCLLRPMLYNSLQLFSNRDLKKSSSYKYNDILNWGYDNWSNRMLFVPDVAFLLDDNYVIPNYIIPNVSFICAAAPVIKDKIFTDKSLLYANLDKIVEHIYFADKNTHKQSDPVLIWKHYNDKTKTIEDIKPNEYVRQKLRLPKKKVLILGPWGCEIKNLPNDNQNDYRKLIAQTFCEVLKKMPIIYDEICFTFPDFFSDDFRIFYSVFKEHFMIDMINFPLKKKKKKV
jgi:hypothetical protein